MERESQSAHSRLIASQLLDIVADHVSQANVYRFCQLLELALPGNPPLGSTDSPADDPVRFRPHPGMGFAASELKSIEFDLRDPGRPATVRTRVLGLYGVDSPMPGVYLDDIAQGREGHEALEAFLDIFNHRIFTQFYRIWRKYSYPASFEPGGTDGTSRCLLGLVGLGIPGTAAQIATPVSRFLALLGIMRLPTRNAEGVVALVSLLAPDTRATVRGHCPVPVMMERPPRLSPEHPVRLGQGVPLSGVGVDMNSHISLLLSTDDMSEGNGWLPGRPLLQDLLVLLRVYLGWRCGARLSLSLPVRCVPPPRLGEPGLLLGMTAVMACSDTDDHPPENARITLDVGAYHALTPHPEPFKEAEHVDFSA
ncbi:type VI secretion system baseplate subunit TssG [Pseudomonas sp. dw_358]|uniref:type VI secretion system baseplate subunit TssG n=1 Tax=Pseudomonas sp. dw_358 TaxID=2720083 RepID=UPI001BD61F05|nr:type VI secretion system baseplate subunit TssG [Pseudomonas sp. dw_358]